MPGPTAPNLTGSYSAVPVHAGQDMAKGTLRGILTTIGMTVDEFCKLL